MAHASLVSSDPSDGAVLRAAPGEITLRFNEPVSPLVFKLIDAKGVARPDLAAMSRGEAVEIRLPPDLPVGTQTLSYRVISADGHPVGGVVAFSVGMPGGGTSAVAPENSALAMAIWAVRAIMLGAMFAGVGGAFFLGWIARDVADRRFARGLRALLGVGVAAIALSIGLQGLDMTDLGAAALTSASIWIAGASGSFGASAALAIAACLLAMGSLLSSAAWSRLLSALALAGLGAAFAATGHASAAPPQWATRPAVFLHVVAAAVWIGALAPLASRASAGAPDLLAALRRFSAVALWVVPPQLCAGLLLAFAQVGALDALWLTAYGEILSAKLVAVALLLGLATLNWIVLTPAVARGGPDARRWILRSIAGEIAVAAMILMLVSGWRLTPPPRALAARTPPGPSMLHIHGERMMATLTFSPGRVGRNRVHIDLLTGDFTPMIPRELTLSLGPADRSIEARAYPARPVGDGGYDIEGVFVPISGVWTIEVSALIDDFTKSELSGEREFAN